MKVFSPCITITFTNFTNVFSEEGKGLLLPHTSEDGSWNSVTHLQTCSGRRIRSPPPTLQMSSQRKGKDWFSLFTFEDGFWNNSSAQVERGEKIQSPSPTLQMSSQKRKRIASPYSSLKMAPRITWPFFKGDVGEGSNHLHQLYRCLLRGRERIASLCVSLKMAPGIAWPVFGDVVEEGSNHLHQLYRCLLRGLHLPD